MTKTTINLSDRNTHPIPLYDPSFVVQKKEAATTTSLYSVRQIVYRKSTSTFAKVARQKHHNAKNRSVLKLTINYPNNTI